MTIEIFGSGCQNCHTLAANARRAAEKVGVPYELYRISDANAISARGVLFTPALAIDGQVRSAGRLLDQAEIETLLTAALCN